MVLARTRWTLACALAVVACGGIVHSDYIKTSGIYAQFVLETTPSSSPLARATFHEQSPAGAGILLSGGDTLLVDGRSTTTDGLGVSPEYTTSIESFAGFHRFVFSRDGESPIVALVPQAPSFSILTPPLDLAYDAQAMVSWAPVLTGATATVTARGSDASCPDHSLGDARNTGTFIFATAALAPTTKDRPDCTYSLEITQDVASSFDGSTGLAGLSAVSRSVQTVPLHVH